MAVDMHEWKFIVDLRALPEFVPAESVSSVARGVDFPAWRAIFTACLLRSHSSGYRLPSFDEFVDECEAVYGHPRHGQRFLPFFGPRWRDQTLTRLNFWYECGLAETYLYVCLVDAIEDIDRNGVVLYDARADWKLKADALVLRAGKRFVVSVAWGGSRVNRPAVEARRDAVERIRKENTEVSSHWRNSEVAEWIRVDVPIDVDNCQTVNGVRLPSIPVINGALAFIHNSTDVPGHLYPEVDEERERLYQSLIGRRRT